MFPWFYFFIVLLHVVALIVWAWRWRRNRIQANLIGNKEQHAYCASCGYDLTGRDVDRLEDVGTAACPECGRAIRAKGDVLIPKHINKQLSHKTFVLMVGVQVFVVAMMGWIFTKQYHSPRPSQTSNTTLMNQAIPFAQAQQNQNAMYELDRRLRNGKLAQTERQTLLASALAYQSDPTKPWLWTFGEWIEQGRADGLITDQEWQQYTAHPGIFQLELREHIYVGDPLTQRVQMDTGKLRTSVDYQFDVYGSLRDEDALLSIYPDTSALNPEAILTQEIRLGTHWPDSFVPTIDGDSPLPVGRYKVVVDASFDWPDPKPGASSTALPIQMTSHIEVHPDTDQLLIPIRDQVLADQIQDNITQELLKSGGTKLRKMGTGTYLSISLKNPLSSIAGSFDVSVDANGLRNTDRWSYEPTNVSNSWHELTFFIPEHLIQNAEDPSQPFDTFTLWLTPNPEHLKHQPLGYEYLDHTLQLRDIPMGLPDP